MSAPEPVNRPLVGILAALCLAAAGICWAWFPEDTAIQGGTLRVGVVLGALWLALPAKGKQVRLDRIAPVLVASVILIVISRKLILVLLPLLAVTGILVVILRPKESKHPPRNF